MGNGFLQFEIRQVVENRPYIAEVEICMGSEKSFLVFLSKLETLIALQPLFRAFGRAL